MNESQTGRTILYVISDMLSVAAAMAAAFWIRFVLFRGENPVGGFGYHLLWAGLFSPVFAVLYALLGVYTPRPQRSYVYQLRSVVLATALGVMLYIDVVFVFRVVDFSRWMILLWFLILCLLVGARGFAVHRLLRSRYRRGQGLKKLVIIGDGAAAADCLRRIRAQTWPECRVIGSIGEKELPDLKRLGSFDRLRPLLDASGADEALIALDEDQTDALGGVLRSCEDTGVKLALLPVSYGYMSSRP